MRFAHSSEFGVRSSENAAYASFASSLMFSAFPPNSELLTPNWETGEW